MKKITIFLIALFLGVTQLQAQEATSPKSSTDELVIVNVDNFTRAETAFQFDRVLTLVEGGEVNKFIHLREPTPLDQQNVIRMNRDTYYSAAIVDITEGATLTIPETEGRYVSAMIINEEHFNNKVYHKPGTYKLTMEEFGTPYVSVNLRILVDDLDPKDIKKVWAIQDGITIEAKSSKPYTHPNYDKVSYEATYKPLIELSRGMPETSRMFGKEEDVDKVRHLLGTAFGWGGLPEREAFYLTIEPNLPVGAYELTVKDVPVDAFWSISSYNRDGYFQENEYKAYSVNNITGTPNKDGSFTIHFGGDPNSSNYLHITEGWNYTVRLYQPREEIIEGEWIFPSVKPVKKK
ncbi:DUF1214 domain-containing protein [Carboxylicivirga sp. N1Y90]|uniref:DUF1214 domain-containing protein n=1 Tax=Carboxylicivirga fragile TaxID=3417571 RepID=UPI003D33CAC2|nr:DUF1214 domain-containing protein [Marinilabiliaceae bacterium N1Y90]